jgi:hypothetical protein
VTKRLKFATEMMRPGAGLHADEARRQVGKPRFPPGDATTSGVAPGSTPILADDVERILADIDADRGDLAVECLGHAILLYLRCPYQFGALAGLEHGRTIPFSDITLSAHAAASAFRSISLCQWLAS